ncbi:14545_t:CDS:2, partial [Funneliformis mosseae]
IALILNGDKSNAESNNSNNTFITYEDPVLITPRLDKEEKKSEFILEFSTISSIPKLLK